jgi:GNAT superfamily N-acetyltransferase
MTKELDLSVGGTDPELAERLSAELTIFNNAATGADDEAGLSVRVVDASGDIVAGLSGWSWGGCGGISLVWVHADHRHEGWGGRMLAAAEAEAIGRGCTRMVVSSFTYQAPEFYRRHGYRETGRTEGLPAGSSDVHFVKYLDESAGSERISLAVILDFTAGDETAGQLYEDAVLPLLNDHDGRLEQRLRSTDGTSEVHLISFGSRAGYESYLADPRRLAHREKVVPFPTRVLEVHPV